jgi:RNA polymerase sigma-70 factor (ECF subfamily)
VGEEAVVDPAVAAAFLSLYERALPEVYGYLLKRVGGDRPVAEDLTSETFLAAVSALRQGDIVHIGVPWLIGTARHKLADHWRRTARTDRLRSALEDEHVEAEDPWDVTLDRVRADGVLSSLGPHHRAALTLRYLDGLGVPEVAGLLGRTVHATEALLVRARNAFRTAYEGGAVGA